MRSNFSLNVQLDDAVVVVLDGTHNQSADKNKGGRAEMLLKVALRFIKNRTGNAVEQRTSQTQVKLKQANQVTVRITGFP